jgi:16S rRNA (guanine(966)-N(2))-methyltransferase RsmD
MRIISGVRKGRHIEPPKNFNSRISTDLSKESLFNILFNWYDFEDLSVLDLFSGTGNISYEFASRGVPDIWSVEQNFGNYQFIKRTAETLQFDAIHSVKANVMTFLPKLTRQFDIVFADPPFKSNLYYDLYELLKNADILTDRGIAVIEHDKHTKFTDFDGLFDQRRYGGVYFSFFKWKNETP